MCECLVAAADYKIFNFLCASEVDVIPSGYFSPPSGACRSSLLARVSNSHKPIKPQLPHGQYTHTHTHTAGLPSISPLPPCTYFPLKFFCKIKITFFVFLPHTLQQKLGLFLAFMLHLLLMGLTLCLGGIQKHCQELLSSCTNQFLKSHTIYARNI